MNHGLLEGLNLENSSQILIPFFVIFARYLWQGSVWTLSI